MKYFSLLLVLLLLNACQQEPDGVNFSVQFAPELSSAPQDGRLLVLLSNDPSDEPRFQIGIGLESQMVFGVDVNGMKPGENIKIDSAFGYPVMNFRDIPPGEYYAQAVINRYETFTLENGKKVKLPPDQGEGQQWNRKPGNFYSKPVKVKIEAGHSANIQLTMDQQIPAIEQPVDSKYVKHIRIESKLLSKFWGKPMFLGAHVLLPEGFEEHPEAKYPLMIYHGHFPSDFGGFQTSPPDPAMDTTDYSSRFGIYGYNKIQQEEAYNFYRQWTAPAFPRFLVVH
jgi:hypothetical protein